MDLPPKEMAKLQANYLHLAKMDEFMIEVLREMGLRSDCEKSIRETTDRIMAIEDVEFRDALIQWINHRHEADIPVMPKWTGQEMAAWIGTTTTRVLQIVDDALRTCHRKLEKLVEDEPTSTSHGEVSAETIQSFTVNEEDTQ
ncbi:hypothetical protein OAK38_06070 [Verrucomicrobia bacterium]|nr:hypothetical protein [Verrucomicrobiota bacterium]